MTTGQMNGRGDPDEVAGDRLRVVLTEAAASVSPTDGSLARVLARTERRSRWSWAAPVLAAAAVVLVATGAVVFTLERGSGQRPGGTATGPSTPTATSPAPSASTSGTAPSPTGVPGGTAHAVPVYYAAVSGTQAKLYREYHTIRSGQPAADAVRQLLGTPPLDSDYQTLWPAGTVLQSYTVSGSVADVVLSAGPAQFPATALQQVVYSVTGADPAVSAVRISYGSTTLAPLARTAATDILAPVWLLEPAQGAVEPSRVRLSGTASVFEATVSWEVDRVNGTVAASGSAQAPIGAPGRGPWSETLTLAPGHYVAKAFLVSPKDGSRLWVDTKTFTVR